MSFILDALRKSETDRQQQSTAEFASVPTSPPPAGIPRWLWIVGLLLAINVVVLVVILLRPQAETPVRTAAEISDVRPASDERILPQNFEDKVATARQNRPERQAEPGTAAPGSVPGSASPRTMPWSANPDSAAPGPVMPVLISQDPTTIPAESLYPSIHEVRANGQVDLPELHLDIHVYNTDPDDRFVFVNMTKLREGAQLSEGPVVVEITTDGVVLRHQGQSFLLPRE